MAVVPLRMNCEVTATSGNSISPANSEPMACDSACSKPSASQ